MERMEQVEKLREKTGCSYSEARAALEESGGDLLEALCWLESHGKSQLAAASCSTENREPPAAEQDAEPETEKADGPFVRGCKSLWQGLVGLLRWGNSNELVMSGKNGRELGIPLTLLVVLLALAFWVVIALVIVALFCGFRFSLEGPAGSEELNNAMGKATEFAEGIKDEIREEGFFRDDSEE